MNRLTRDLGPLLLLLALLTLLAGCKASVDAAGHYVRIGDEGTTLDLFEDGSYRMKTVKGELSGSWEMSNDDVAIAVAHNPPRSLIHRYIVDGGYLIPKDSVYESETAPPATGLFDGDFLLNLSLGREEDSATVFRFHADGRFQLVSELLDADGNVTGHAELGGNYRRDGDLLFAAYDRGEDELVFLIWNNAIALGVYEKVS